MVNVDLSGAKIFFDPAGPDYAAAAEAHRTLFGRSGTGGDLVGWLDLPQRVLDGELKGILNTAEKIKRQSDALLVLALGGSYLGARAAIEMLQTPSHNRISGKTEVYFMGNSLSPDAVNELIALLGDKDFSVNVISKYGDAIEIAVAFRVAKALLERKYGRAGAKRRIYITADAEDGALRTMAKNEGYESLVIPSDVGERFGVLSAAGLLPMAVAGIDIKTLLLCAADEMRTLAVGSPENPAWQYAAARQHLYRRGKNTEILAYYEPAVHFFAEWWKLLFGESEGKNSIGIFPAAVEYNADIYSMGQYIQDGPRSLMETLISFEKNRTEYKLPFEMGDPDGLNYLAGQPLSHIMDSSLRALRSAHISGGVPNIGISVPCRDEAGFAALVCFFQVSCAISSYMMGVNPFSAHGINEYKDNMQRLLKEEK